MGTVPLPRDRSSGAASVGARRVAPAPPLRAPSVRSDERPLATQGDLLNSIKFQRRIRENFHPEKLTNVFMVPKKKSSTKTLQSDSSAVNRLSQDTSSQKEKMTNAQRGFSNVPRPSSPKGRRNLDRFARH